MSYAEPLKDYLVSGSLKQVYESRRWSIRYKLSSMTMQELEQRKSSYDEALKTLDEKIEKLQNELGKVKAGDDSFTLVRDDVSVVYSGKLNPAKFLSEQLARVEEARRWLQRERRIFAWEIRRRRLRAAVKLPFLKIQLSQSIAEARKLYSQIRECSLQLKRLCQEYSRVYSVFAETYMEIGKLAFQKPELTLPNLNQKVQRLAEEIEKLTPAIG